MFFTIRRATIPDIPAVASMAGLIWHSAAPEELASDFACILNADEAAVFLAFEDETAWGFAQCGMRHDYVEGTRSSPVGYLEGIFVKPEYRSRGCARALLSACEDWAREKGCTEFASDCELTNTESLSFHRNVGFREANRIICFTKIL